MQKAIFMLQSYGYSNSTILVYASFLILGSFKGYIEAQALLVYVNKLMKRTALCSALLCSADISDVSN